MNINTLDENAVRAAIEFNTIEIARQQRAGICELSIFKFVESLDSTLVISASQRIKNGCDLLAAVYCKVLPTTAPNGADGVAFHNGELVEVELKMSGVDLKNGHKNYVRNVLGDVYRTQNPPVKIETYLGAAFSLFTEHCMQSKKRLTILLVPDDSVLHGVAGAYFLDGPQMLNIIELTAQGMRLKQGVKGSTDVTIPLSQFLLYGAPWTQMTVPTLGWDYAMQILSNHCELSEFNTASGGAGMKGSTQRTESIKPYLSNELLDVANRITDNKLDIAQTTFKSVLHDALVNLKVSNPSDYEMYTSSTRQSNRGKCWSATMSSGKKDGAIRFTNDFLIAQVYEDKNDTVYYFAIPANALMNSQGDMLTDPSISFCNETGAPKRNLKYWEYECANLEDLVRVVEATF